MSTELVTKKKQTLLDISSDLHALQALLDEAAPDGEIAEDVDKMLTEWFVECHGNLKVKLDNYTALIRDFELRASVRKAEMERLAMRVRVDENAVKRLKDRLFYFLDMNKIDKIATDRFNLGIQKNGGKVPLTITADPTELPFDYQKVETKADTDKIRKALEAGGSIPGCKLEERGRHLRIS